MQTLRIAPVYTNVRLVCPILYVNMSYYIYLHCNMNYANLRQLLGHHPHHCCCHHPHSGSLTASKWSTPIDRCFSSLTLAQPWGWWYGPLLQSPTWLYPWCEQSELGQNWTDIEWDMNTNTWHQSHVNWEQNLTTIALTLAPSCSKFNQAKT